MHYTACRFGSSRSACDRRRNKRTVTVFDGLLIAIMLPRTPHRQRPLVVTDRGVWEQLQSEMARRRARDPCALTHQEFEKRYEI